MKVNKKIYDWYNNLKAEGINKNLIIATITLTGWKHGATKKLLGIQ